MSRLTILCLALLVGCNTPPAATDAPNAPATTTTATTHAAQAAADAGIADPVARVGGQPITLAELDESAKAELMKLHQQIFDTRKQGLDRLIDMRLLEAEASSRSMTTEELLKIEVESKTSPITDADIQAFFEQNQARMRGSVEDMQDPIKRHLAQQQGATLMMALTKQLREKSGVEIFLEQPRVIVDPGDSPRYGNVAAPVQIIEFSDFQCPYCTRGAETLTQVKEKYGDKVTIVFRHFPLPMHDRAHRAAEASECANEQGKFWEYHDQLFANQRAMTEENLASYAENVKIDAAKFNECLTSGRHVATVEQDMKEGAAAGMSGTPGFFINGVFLGGAMPIEQFSEVIDAELAGKSG